MDGSGDNTNSDSLEGTLTYIQTQMGPKVTLDDPISLNLAFMDPRTVAKSEITFRSVVISEDGTASGPDEVEITVNPT